MEGKLFFAIMANRLTEFVLANGYIDTTVQKVVPGVPGFPGCLGHACAIWHTIQKARQEKANPSVVRLDLASAYGSVPHRVIREALEFYWVPEGFSSVIKNYFNKFTMRYATRSYTTGWQILQKAIAMGCIISPVLFVMVIEMLVKAAEGSDKGVSLTPGQTMPPIRAFMDDLTILEEDTRTVERTLARLEELIIWARMRFKPKKSRRLTIRKGRVVPQRFRIAGEDIPTVKEQPVKSLSRMYEFPSPTDTRN